MARYCNNNTLLKGVSLEEHEEFQITLSLWFHFFITSWKKSVFDMELLKLSYIDFDKCFSIFFPEISNIDLNMAPRFLSLKFFIYFHYSILFWRTIFWDNIAEKYFMIWYSGVYFGQRKLFWLELELCHLTTKIFLNKPVRET